MPYDIRKRGNKFCVINKETKEDKGCSDSYERAVAHMRLLFGVEHGMKPRSTKKD